jgi:putative metallohydrolase (TIGR04338 family)
MNKETAKTYEAEHTADYKTRGMVSVSAHVYLDTEGRIKPESCQHYLDHVMAQEWFMAAFPNQAAPVTVVAKGRSRSSCYKQARKISMSTYFRDNGTATCERCLLHELAHLVTRGTGDLVTHPHGHAFRVNHVRIVRGMLGDQAAYLLRRQYEKDGVPTHK